jgi:hypothetical protein
MKKRIMSMRKPPRAASMRGLLAKPTGFHKKSNVSSRYIGNSAIFMKEMPGRDLKRIFCHFVNLPAAAIFFIPKGLDNRRIK